MHLPCLLVAIGILLLLSACGSSPTANGVATTTSPAPTITAPSPLPTVDTYRFDPGTTPEDVARYLDTRRQCRLSDSFVRLISLPNPERRARGMGLKYENNHVEVMIESTGDVDWDDLIRRYQMQEIPSSRSPKLIGARAPLDTLCDLSNDPRVKTIVELLPGVPGAPGLPPQPSPRP